MAIRKLLYTGSDGHISEPGLIRLDKDGKIGPEVLTFVNDFMGSIVRKLNGGLTFGSGEQGTIAGNFFGQWVEVTTPNSADTEFEVPHGLKIVPHGIIPIFIDKGAVLYASRYGSWNNEIIYLKCNTADVLTKFIVVG